MIKAIILTSTVFGTQFLFETTAQAQQTTETVATQSNDPSVETQTPSEQQFETLKNTVEVASRAKSIGSGDAAEIANTAVSVIVKDAEQAEAINGNIDTANTARKIATGNVGALAKVIMNATQDDTKYGPSLRKLKIRASKTTGVRSRDLDISDVNPSQNKIVYKAVVKSGTKSNAKSGTSYWCFVDYDGKKTSAATCSAQGQNICNPTRKAAGEC